MTECGSSDEMRGARDVSKRRKYGHLSCFRISRSVQIRKRHKDGKGEVLEGVDL